jgi:hypothetical protein
MVCCVFQETNLVNYYGQRKSARTFASRQEASNKLYTVLAIWLYSNVIQLNLILFVSYFLVFQFQNLLSSIYKFDC